MSIAGSTRSGEQSRYTPPGDRPGTDASPKKTKRTRIFRWQGIIPLILALGLFAAGWLLFGERAIRETLSEAATKALGAQFDIEGLKIDAFATTLELRDIALADPFDRNRNLLEAKVLRLELEPRPLLERKVVIKRFAISDVQTGTERRTPAQPVSGSGFAPLALAEMQRWSQQFNVPLLSLVPIDSLKSIVLDPSQLKAVQAALAVGHEADSVKQSIENSYAALRLQETIDSSAALVSRLRGTNVRTLGIDGARRAVADVRQSAARVDSAKARVEAMVADARRGVDSLQVRIRAIDDARREDYEFARSLLKLPSFDAPDIGASLFGAVTIERFQRAMYWATLAREYAPAGLVVRESPGPERLRRSGTTVRFATPGSHPRFLLRRADVNVTVTSGAAAGTYSFAAADVTTDPAIVGRPTLFALRRTAQGSDLDSLLVTGSLDHTGERPKQVLNVQASGIKLPPLSVPVLPYSMDPGKGRSELRFVVDGEQLSGRWVVRSNALTWRPDSARARRLNTMESLVARVLTGVRELDLTADVSGTIKTPKLAVKSNLDRQVADRLKAVAGEEIAAAQAKVRAEVDKLVEEKSAPVKARVAELRSDTERRVAEARGKLDEEKRKLDERLKELSGGLVNLPRLPGA